MTKGQRTFLFFALLLIFLITTPLLLLYYAGYRFDLEHKILTQTGALYLKVIPKQTVVRMETQQKKKTDWLFGALLIDDLLPKSYLVQVEKEGYIPWKKTLDIQKREVTEAKNIILLPRDIQWKMLFDHVEHFWVSPDKTRILLQRNIPQQGRKLTIWEREENKERLVWQKLSDNIQEVIWRGDSHALLIQLKEANGFGYLLYENTRGEQLTFLPKSTTRVTFASLTDTALFIQRTYGESSSLSLGNYEDRLISPPFATNVVSFAPFSNLVTWIDANGILWQKETLSLTSPSPLNSPSTLLLQKDASLLVGAKGIFLLNGTTPLFFHRETNTFEEIGQNKKEILLSPDGNKAVLFSLEGPQLGEIELFFLEDDHDQPQRKKGEKVFITRMSDPLGQIFWMSSHYLIFSSGNEIKTVEIDTRNEVNIAHLATLISPDMFWDEKEKTLLVLSKEILSISERFF